MAAQPLRSQYYRNGRGAAVVARMPAALRAVLGLDEDTAVRSGRLQIGPRPSVQPGMVHVDTSRAAPHVEVHSRPWSLRLGGQSAKEIVAFGVLDHLAPADGPFAIGHWFRVLGAGGRLVVGVDDSSDQLGDHVGHVQALWARQEGAPAHITSPLQIPYRRGARTKYDERLLRHVLECGGFEVVALHRGGDLVFGCPADWPGLPPVPDELAGGAEIVAVCRAR